jgi:hypothetical protein
MKRLIFAIALLSAFAMPAAASVTKGPVDTHRQIERPAAPGLSKLRRTPAQVRKDPYWQPCDYSSDNGENACGG